MKGIPGPVDWGLLVLRLVLGGSFIVHGVQKLFGALGGAGIEAFAGGVARLGLPGPAHLWAYLAAGSELAGGLVVFFGVLTEFGALAIAFVMIVAIWKVTGRHGFSAVHNGYEYNLLILAACAALILAGPGWLALWDPFRFRRGARSGSGWAAVEG
jgi:putative oxidoreductase